MYELWTGTLFNDISLMAKNNSRPFFAMPLGACVENKNSNNRNPAREKNEFRLTKTLHLHRRDYEKKNVPFLTDSSSMKE